MANGTSDPLLERSKFYREHGQTIISLATGSFVLSVTFLHDIAPKAKGVNLLKTSWYLFVAAILLGLVYNYVLSIYVRVKGDKYGPLLTGISLFFHASFAIAMIYLLRFGTANL